MGTEIESTIKSLINELSRDQLATRVAELEERNTELELRLDAIAELSSNLEQ